MNIYEIVIPLIIVILLGNMIKTGIEDEIGKYNDNQKAASLQKTYDLEPIEDSILNYLKQTKYKSNGKKLVIYLNYENKADKEFSDIFGRYKNSPEWNKKYSFTEYKISAVDNKNHFKNQNFEDFAHSCGTFCILDLKTNMKYSSQSAERKKLDESLYAFYNK